MSVDVVKFAFIGGEISPKLFGRTDLTKYDLAMAKAQNFFVDYRGGLSSRPGTEFVDWVLSDDKITRMVPFNFSPDTANSYVILFGDGYIRFIQDGAYVLKDSVVVTGITNANPGVVTATTHGLTTGDWIKVVAVGGMTELNGRTYQVTVLGPNTFRLSTIPDLTTVNTTGFGVYTSGGTVAAVYQIPSPYTESDLAGLTFEQYRDLIRITSRDFPPKELIRSDHASWAISDSSIAPFIAGVNVTGHSASDTGSASTVFGVTKVIEDGSESVLGNLRNPSSIVNYPATEGSIQVSWAAASDAKYYNVYRSVVGLNAQYEGAELGYLGRSYGTSFVDPNIIPDYTKTPSIHLNPFAPGRITNVEITAGGTGYSNFATTVSISDSDGSGFQGQVVTDSAGAVVHVIIKSGGAGYTSPTVSFAGGGTGATADATASPLVGTYPALSKVFQQRQCYAASENSPITVWGSRIKSFNDFSSSEFQLDNDPFEFDLDTPAVNPIRHLISTRGGLLAMTQEDVWLINGGAAGTPITPSSALADPQSYNGVSNIYPLLINNDILFADGIGHSINVLTYNEISKVYGAEDKSIFANHLFGIDKDITSWAYQKSPFKAVWAVRSDGALLSFTYVRDEEVFAWTPCSTKGKFLDVVVVRETDEDRVYVTTERYINNRWTKFIERLDLRNFINVEDSWNVDAGLSLGMVAGSGTLTITSAISADEWTVKTSTEVLTGKEGYFIRGAGGIFKILTVTSSKSATVELYASPTNFIPESNNTVTFPITSWTIDQSSAAISGLWHLEGETVSILADGSVLPVQTVVDGAVTLPQAASRVIIGLGYKCHARTLPVILPDIHIESKRKRICGIGIRLDSSRGLKIGPEESRVHPIRTRTTEDYGKPTKLINGLKYMLLETDWNEEGQTEFILEDPLPVNILSLIFDIEVGDEPD